MPSIINMEQITSDPYTTADKPQNTSTTVLPSVSPDTKSAVPHKLTYIYICIHVHTIRMFMNQLTCDHTLRNLSMVLNAGSKDAARSSLLAGTTVLHHAGNSHESILGEMS